MSQDIAPDLPKADFKFIDLDTGKLTSYGVQTLEQIWRQVAAGVSSTPCTSVHSGASKYTLTPMLQSEGARTYGNYMPFIMVADATSNGAVTALVTSQGKPLAEIKVYKTNGAAQAVAGDIVLNSLYLFIYNSALDGGAGGFVLK